MSRSRSWTLVPVLVMGLALAGLTARPPDSHGQGVPLGLAMNVHARAWPTEPEPGQQQTSLGMRPVSAEVAVAAPPAATFGRASVLDMGFAEGLRQPPEESYVSCDTIAVNVDDDAESTAGPVHMAARCDHLAGTAEATTPLGGGAAGGLAGTAHSFVAIDAAGDAVRVRVEADVSGIQAGVLTARNARYRAVVVADGTPGGVEVDAAVDVTDAEAGGVPVVVGPDGVTVDEGRVPALLVPEATALVAEYFASPYSDVRVTQPDVEISPEGDRVTVRGGGMHVRFASSDDPADRYFVATTFVGGEIDVLLGEALAAIVPEGPVPVASPPAPAGAVPGPTGAPPRADGAAGAPAAPGDLAGPDAGGAAPIGLVDPVTTRRTLPTMGPWWLVVLLVGVGLLAAERLSTLPPLVPARRRVLAAWDATAERFLRG